MEEENEKLERLLLSVLPQHVALEMKQDIIAPVTGKSHFFVSFSFHEILMKIFFLPELLYVFVYICIQVNSIKFTSRGMNKSAFCLLTSLDLRF